VKIKLILLKNTDKNCEQIADRLFDFTEFCVQQRYPIHAQDDTSPITIADEDYIFVIKAGHVFWDTSIFDQCIEESNEAVMGNENWFLINCKLLYVSNRPTKTFSNKIETLKAFCYPETYYSEIEQLMENLDYPVPKKIEPFAFEIREAARNLDVGYYVVNTEDVSIENKFDKKFDNYIGVCGGLKTYILLGQDYFTNDTSVLMFDISPAAIEWQKYLREHWDGNADSFIQISQDFKELRPEYIAIQDSYRTLERYLNENNISKHDLQTWWNKFQKLNVEYKQIDLFSSSDVLELAKYTENKNNTYFWLSNCFVMERLVFQYGCSHTLEKDFKDTFRQLSNSPCTYDISLDVE
jgi:hypothetical protein